jgi:hypothetical protein
VLAGMNTTIELLADKMNASPQQTIVVQSSGKTFAIQRTPTGYKGQILK